MMHHTCCGLDSQATNSVTITRTGTFVSMCRSFLRLDVIDIIFQVYANFCVNKIIFNVGKRSFSTVIASVLYEISIYLKS